MGDIEHLVGRDDTMGRLRVLLDRALARRGRLVLLEGEPGIGKTSVLNALADEASDRAMAVAWGQCWDDSLAPAFWPWTQVLRELGDLDDDAYEVRVLTGPGGRTDRDQPADRFELFDSVRSLVVEAAAPNGLMIALDDLQWADDASLALLSFAARHVEHARVLIVGAFRDVETGPALDQLRGTVETIAVEPLTDAAATRLARDVCGDLLQPGPIADLVRRAGGNPLFVRELTRLVVAGRAAGTRIRHDSGGVREVVAQRVARLTPACQNMLDVLAVLGADARRDALHRMLGRRDDLSALLAEAMHSKILVSSADELTPPTFVHDLFREELIAALAPATKAQLHLTVARTLEQLGIEGASVPAEVLAAHYVAAASLGLRPAGAAAVVHSRAAAAAATQQLAFEDAVGHLRRAVAALQLGDRPDVGSRLDLLLSLGEALDRAGDPTSARSIFIEAADLARQVDDAEGFAQAAIGIHRLGALSGLPRDANVRLLEEGATRLPGETALRVRVLAALARELHHTWDPAVDDRARDIAGEAAAAARRLDDGATHAVCLLALHDTVWSVGSATERLPIVAEMMELAGLSADRELFVQAQLLKATALLELGDASAPRELARYCHAADDLGHARGHWGALSRRAVLKLLAGEFEEAAQLGTDAARLGEEIGEPDTPGVRDMLLWELARFGDGWAALAPQDHWVPPGSWPPMKAVLLTARGEVAAAHNALTGYSLARDLSHGVRRHDGWMPMVATEAVVAVGTRAQVEEVYEWLRPLSGNHVVYGGCVGYGGAIDHHLGALAASLGRRDEAADHLRAALSMHETIGAAAWAALDRSLLADDSRQTATNDRGTGETDDSLRREGDSWRVSFRGRSSTVRHVKGMLDLAVLLERPGQEVSALELMGGADVGGAPGPVLDHQARRNYQTRVRELQLDIDDAKAANDWVRTARAEAELDVLVDQLSQAFGLGGRSRTGGSTGERARAAVTHRIRGAIRRITEFDPVLGQHLMNAVKTGTWCVYQPDTPVTWIVRR